jgi:hypothetical protein
MIPENLADEGGGLCEHDEERLPRCGAANLRRDRPVGVCLRERVVADRRLGPRRCGMARQSTSARAERSGSFARGVALLSMVPLRNADDGCFARGLSVQGRAAQRRSRRQSHEPPPPPPSRRTAIHRLTATCTRAGPFDGPQKRASPPSHVLALVRSPCSSRLYAHSRPCSERHAHSTTYITSTPLRALPTKFFPSRINSNPSQN